MNDNLYMGEVGLAALWDLMKQYVDGKIFIGTQEEYDKVSDTLAIGSLVIIIDNKSEITSVLGEAILGKMILGE